MKLNVAENTKRNMLWGAIQKVYQILIPFILRAVLIRQLGIEYVGLSGLFSSLLNFLNLAELGIGSAVQFFLYQPIAENDEDTIRRLLGLIQDTYRRIGLFIFGVGMLLMPFLRLLISEDLPDDINIYVIYLLNLLQTILPYWLFACKSTVLEAYQRNDVSSRIYLTTSTVRYILQFIILFCLPNYYIYFIIVILTQIMEKILLTIVVDRKYPQYRATLPASQDMRKQVSQKSGGLLLHRIGGVIVNSADALVITAFLGLGTLGKYQNYLQIMSAVSGIVGLVNSSWRAGIGNKMAREGVGAAHQSFEHSTFLTFCISTICCCCFLNLYQPFISLWVGADMLLDDGIILLLCVYFYTTRLMSPGNMFESIGGMWLQDKYRPLMEGLFNLGLNLILVQTIGLYGILLSTILSMGLLSIPWLYRNVVGNLFKKSIACYLGELLLYAISTTAICAVSYFVCIIIPSSASLVMVLLIRALVSVVIPLSLLCLLYHKRESWKWMVNNIFRLVRLRGF